MTPECSIVIPVHNHASVTRHCLNALLAQPSAVPFEIIVVDDGSTDETARLLPAYGDRIRVVTHPGSEGFAAACNHGAMTARGDFLVFLNNDIRPQRGWLDALVDSARRHPRTGIVGAKLLFPNDTIQHAGVVFGTGRMPAHVYYGLPADFPAANKPRRYQAVTGACLLVRRALFHELGGFDLAYRNVYEDVDLCLRAGQLGHEIRYCPTSVLYHLQSVSRGHEVAADPSKTQRHAAITLWTRWRDVVACDEMRVYEEDGLIQFATGATYPRDLTVSPFIGRVDRDGAATETDRILAARSRQVGDLLSRNIALDLRVQQFEQQTLAGIGGGQGTMPRTWPALRASASFMDIRGAVAGLYLEGAGLEVGALHAPMPVDASVSVRYVDRMTVADLRRQYPELDALPLVEPDILDDGERLATIADASQDFVIASHFLEHCQDPIGTVEHMLRVVRPGGVLYLAVPDKRYTFDRKRPVTPIEHLFRDHEEGPAWSREAHFEEWVALCDDEHIRGRTARELMDFDYSIHFHVWTQAEVLELFAAMKTRYRLDFEVETVVRNALEVILILRKGAVPDLTSVEGADVAAAPGEPGR